MCQNIHHSKQLIHISDDVHVTVCIYTCRRRLSHKGFLDGLLMDSPPSPVFLLSGGSLWSCKQWCTWESQTDMWDTDRPLPQLMSLVHRRKNTGVIMTAAFQLAEVLLLWIRVSFSLLCYSGQLQITGVAWQVDQMKVIGLNPCSEVGIYLSEITFFCS